MPKPGHELDVEEIAAYCRERMAAYMVPRFVEFAAELPRTPTGKIEKFRLRERGPGRRDVGPRAPAREDGVSTATDHLAQRRAAFRAFFAEHCPEEYADACDRAGRFPHELYAAAAAAGLFRVSVPAEHGGDGFDPHTLTVLLQEAGRAFPDFANTIVRSQTLCMTLVGQFGSERQQRELLPRFADGSMHMAFAISEPEAGSDALALYHDGAEGRRRLGAAGHKRYTRPAPTSPTRSS